MMTSEWQEEVGQEKVEWSREGGEHRKVGSLNLEHTKICVHQPVLSAINAVLYRFKNFTEIFF